MLSLWLSVNVHVYGWGDVPKVVYHCFSGFWYNLECMKPGQYFQVMALWLLIRRCGPQLFKFLLPKFFRINKRDSWHIVLYEYRAEKMNLKSIAQIVWWGMFSHFLGDLSCQSITEVNMHIYKTSSVFLISMWSVTDHHGASNIKVIGSIPGIHFG